MDYRDDEYAQNWIKALRKYYWEKSCLRYDLSMYVCGVSPQRRDTWIPTDTPHASYTGGRDLISAELHLPGVDSIIRSLYERVDDSA